MNLEDVLELLAMLGRMAEVLESIKQDDPEAWEKVKANFNQAKERFKNA